MLRKAGPLFYLDTHAGAGLYQLSDERASKTGEAKEGVLALDFDALSRDLPDSSKALLASYRNAIAPFLARNEYPGSPLLAAQAMREIDRLALCELHPAEFSALSTAIGRDRRVKRLCEDGFNSYAKLPGVHKRALVLVDPPYEVKADYGRVVQFLTQVHRRMRGAVLLLWYPVVERGRIDEMFAGLVDNGLKDLWQCELGVAPDSDGHGMTASGMALVNPPWELPGQLESLLPLLQQQLAPAKGYSLVQQVVAEAP